MTDIQQQLCNRCKEQPAVANTRKELFCKECFSKFILLKQRRTLISDKDRFLQQIMKVTFKTPNDDKILLALSMGKSSLIVLQNLIEYLNNQYSQQQQTGFILETITVVENEEEYVKFKTIVNILQTLPEFQVLKKGSIKFRVVNINKLLAISENNKLQLLRLSKSDYKLIVQNINDNSNDITLDEILVESFGNQAKTLTSKEDFKNIAINNAIEAVYKKYNYVALVYGSSMTKLATEIVTNTVTGRGDVIARNLDMKFYPLTDVFYSEVEAYYDLVINNKDILLYNEETGSSSSSSSSTKKVLLSNELASESQPKSRKTKTISDITLDYFNTIEGDYASVISTVVKTGLKLKDPNSTDDLNEKFNYCKICQNKISNKHSPAEWINNITVMKPAIITTDSEKANFENWEKEVSSIEKANAKNLGDDELSEVDSGLCYGCIVTLNTSLSKSVKWTEKTDDDSLLEQVLEEYVL